jgi:PPOX class probable F420-dependent enzyme
MSLIPEHFIDILQSKALAHVATIGPKGEPQSSAVWFNWDGTHILFAMKKERQKYRNLLRDPRIAVSIVDPANLYRLLEIRGKVRIEEDRNYRFINAMSQKYLNRDTTVEEGGPEEERVVIFVEPERVIPFAPFQEDKK